MQHLDLALNEDQVAILLSWMLTDSVDMVTEKNELALYERKTI